MKSAASPLDPAITRRTFLRLGLVAGGSTLIVSGLPACGARPDEAFEPWDYPRPDGEAIELQLVGAAILAANPHDTQPWWFRASPTAIDVHFDPTRSLGAMDGLHREAYIGLGCAIENLVIAAGHFGLTADVELLPSPGDETHAAHVALSPRPTSNAREELFDAIPRRHTNRGAYVESAVPPGLVEALRALIDDPRVEATFLVTPEAKARFRAATLAATRAIVADREMNEDSHAWYRHDAAAVREHRDGTTLDASGAAWLTRTLGSATARPSAETAGDYWIDATEHRHATGSAIVILSSTDRDDRADQLAVGRIYQRLHLFATVHGLAMQPLNQLAERQDREVALGLPPDFTAQLAELAGTPEGSRAQMLFRIGYAIDDAPPSPRRPVAWVVRS